MTSRTRRALLVALPLIAVTLAGCELRADVGIDVTGAGGGTLAVTLAADQELQQAARRAGADPLSTLAEAGRQLDGWQVDRDEGTPGAPVTLSADFADPGELASLSRALADAVAAPELRPLEAWSLELDDRTVELTGGASLAVTSKVTALGVRPARATRILADSAQLRVIARMPGGVLETNGEVGPDATVVTWTVPAGERRSLSVVARRPDRLARLVRRLATPLGAVVMLALAVVATAFVIVRRRRAAARRAASTQAFAPWRSARMRSRSLRT